MLHIYMFFYLNLSSGEFTFINIICSTLLVLSLVRLSLIMSPVLENIRSHGTDGATILQCVT